MPCAGILISQRASTDNREGVRGVGWGVERVKKKKKGWRLFSPTLWPRLKEPSVCLSRKTSFGCVRVVRACGCVFTGHVAWRERSLAAHVTVALWLSVQWTCCSGEKAGGWYPTYLITDDVHHTSLSSTPLPPPPPPLRPIDFTVGRPSEKLKGLWAHAQ